MLRPPLLLSLKAARASLSSGCSSSAGRVCRASVVRPAAAPSLVRRLSSESSPTETPDTAPSQSSSKSAKVEANANAKGERSEPAPLRISVETLAQRDSILPHRPNLWLRDVCPCERCVDPHSGQKSFATSQLDFLPEVRSSERAPDGSLTVVWANDPVSGGRDHVSVYPPAIADGHDRFPRRELWNRALSDRPGGRFRISYADWIAGGDAFWRGLAALSLRGIIFVHDLPAGDERAVERVGEQIGPLQETFYGRTWDVVSKPRAENVAYTNHFLGLHQDLLYYPDPPRIQLLHCLANDCSGGESLFADGVFAATAIARSRPTTYHQLARHPTAYHYDRNGNTHYAERPVVRGKPATAPAPAESVWWSPPFQAPFPAEVHRLAAWHLAARQFQAEIEHPDNVVEYRLQPGECVVFDNWRVLHGRREFHFEGEGSQGGGAGGKRWLKGTYVADHAYRARLDDVPAPVAERHRLWTTRQAEREANRRAVEDAAAAADRVSGAAEKILGAQRRRRLTTENAQQYLEELLGRKLPEKSPELPVEGKGPSRQAQEDAASSS